MALRVLYEDPWIIAVDKPPGLVVHPTYRNWTGTLLNALLWHVRGREDAEPRIITRLDKGTSGVVLAALSARVHALVQDDAARGLVSKEYLAIVRGLPAPERGVIELPLARSPEDRRRVVVDDRGQASRTEYALLGRSPGRAALRCRLLTGRTHQIRVHLAAMGWPVEGDPVYGAPCTGLERQALHAWRVLLPHPVSRTAVEIEAPLPPDLLGLIGDQNLTL